MSEKSLIVIQPDQLDLIKRTIAPDATPDELKLFFYDCQRRNVHPLDKLIHFSKRGGKYVPLTSIDYLRSRAADTGILAGIDDAVYIDSGTFPSQATVTVYRLISGTRCPFTATARWNEYCPKDEKQAFMWKKMPYVMIAKCAEALALRKAFPQQLAGLYANEELDQAQRPIIEAEPIQTRQKSAQSTAAVKAPTTSIERPPQGSFESVVDGGEKREDLMFEDYKVVNSKPDSKSKWTAAFCKFSTDSGSEFEAGSFDAKIIDKLDVLKGQPVTIIHSAGKKQGTRELLSIEPTDDIPI